MKKKGKIKITLMSDLCTSSGYSFARIIDSDVCYDEYGFPYIPGKRLKGCLRETYESILSWRKGTQKEDIIKRIFGEEGNRDQGNLTVGNAYIQDYVDLRKALSVKRRQPEVKEYYSTQKILERFTNVVGQTKLKDGIAEDNTLRYTRSVNKTNPLSCAGSEDNKLVFYSSICFDSDDEDLISDMVCGTRHIGLKRNRGFGNIRCELNEDPEEYGNVEIDCKKSFYLREEEDEAIFNICVKNIEPLMLSGMREDESVNYIPAQSLLGVLAARYLDKPDKNDDSQEFADLFINGKTKYSNLYPTDGKNKFYPAPEYINKLKKTGEYVNTIMRKLPEKAVDLKYDWHNGNIPKKLKGKYVALEENRVSVLEVKKDLIYHHSHYKKNSEGKEGLLYGLEVIHEDQLFMGEIIIPVKYKDVMIKLLSEGDLYFGKSKSSQYGKCRLIHAICSEGSEKTQKSDILQIEENDDVVVTFLSDTIILDQDKGEYTVYYDEIFKNVGDELNCLISGKQEEENFLRIKREDDTDENSLLSMIRTTMITGYNRKWNLRKPAIPAIKAGSCLVFRALKGFKVSGDFFIGERNQEGFGMVRLHKGKAEFEMEQVVEETGETFSGADSNVNLKQLMIPVLLESWLEQKEYEKLFKNRIRISSSALGRLKMMLRESLDKNRTDTIAALDDFEKRILSIKTDSVKKEAQRLLHTNIAEKKNDEWNWKFGGTLDDEGTIKELKNLGMNEEEISSAIHDLWGEYLLTILTELKYRGEGDK